MITIKNVWIEWLVDETSDLSWLDRTAEDHYGEDGCNWNHVSEETKAKTVEKYGSLMAACEQYAKEDQERLKAFYNGKWCMMGCVAHATVCYLQKHSYRQEHLRSGGSWGIESDASNDYRDEIETEQLAELKAHLEIFGVNTTDFWAIYEEGR